MKTKQLNITIEGSCHNCPYCEYDPHYSISYDSGYDCNHPDAEDTRIVDDHQIEIYQKKVREAERLPLLPEEVTDPNPMSIPDWCPLEDAS